MEPLHIYETPYIDQRTVLFEILGTLQSINESSDRYLSQIGEKEVINPFQEDFQKRAKGNNAAIPAELLAELGIRSVTLNKLHKPVLLPEGVILPLRRTTTQYKWHNFRNAPFLEKLKTILKDCDVIAFSDWAIVEDALQLWNGFLSDVIKPLHRKDLNFIFYLGDPAKRPTHQVDEIIDIISDFSIHGQVTFLLSKNEAVKLWMILHGENSDQASHHAASPGLREKYRSIFNTMSVNRLLIYSIDHVILLSGQQQFELTRRATTNRKISQEVKDNFNAGYSLGLLLQLDISHCVALGLTVSGAYLETGTSPDREALLSYIKIWIGELGADNH